jgi:PAS domain S-box-containing protein
MSPKTKSQLETELQQAKAQIAGLERDLKAAQAGRREKPYDQDQPLGILQLEEKFRWLLEMLPIGISILNAEKRVVFSNHILQDIVQLTEEGFASGSYQSRRYLRVDGSPMLSDEFASAQATKSGQPVFNVETGIVKEDGETIWTSVSAVPVEFPDWRIVIVTSDITERKRTQDELQNQRRDLKALIENTDESIWTVDSEYRLIVGNELYHQNTSAVLNRRFTNGECVLATEFPQAALDEWRGYYDRALDGERFSVEVQTRFANPVSFVEYRFNPIVGDSRDIIGVTVSGRDISERRHLEASLRESEQRYTLLFQKSTIPVLLVKLPEMIIADANEAAEELTGYAQEEMLGRNAAEIGLISHTRRTEAITQFEKERMLAGNEMRIVTRSDEERIVIVNTNPLEIDGKPFAITSMQDVTERKRAEQALRRSEELFRVAMEFLPVPIALADTAGHILRFNQRFIENYGYTVQDLPTVDDWMLHAYPDPEYRAEVAANWNQRISDSLEKDLPTPLREFNVTCKDGSQRTVEIINRGVQGLILASFNDITERKQAETALQESEERFRILFETMVQGVLFQDARGRIFLANSAAQRILGLSLDQLMGKEISNSSWTVMREDGSDYPVEERPTVVALRTGKPVIGAILGITNPASENRRWLSINAVPRFKPGETRPYQVYSTLEDITERKQAEIALVESRAQLDAALESMTDAVFISDTAGTFTRFNEAFATFHKFKNKAECAKTLAEYPDFLDVYMDTGELAPLEMWAVPRALRGETATNAEYGLHRRDTGDRWIGSYSFAPIRNPAGEIVGSVVVGRDITERRRLDEIRAKLTERLDLATRSARMGIWDWDIRKNKIIWDDQMYALYGLQPGEFGGAYEAWLHGVHLEDREPSNATSAAAVRGEREYDTEFRVVWPDGSVHWLKANGQVFRDENGTPLRMVGVNYDITERKRAEQELILQTEQLREQAELLEYAHVLVRDMENRIVMWNQGMEKLYGWTKEEALGQMTHALFQTEFPVSFGTYQAELVQSGRWQGELTHIRKDGTKITVLSHQSLYHGQNGQPYLILEVNNDITGRKLAEDALRLSEENFASAFRTNPSALAITRRVDGRFIVINEAYTSIMGYGPAEIIGHDVLEFSIYADPQERVKLLQKLAEQGGVSNYELTVRNKDRGLRQILISMEPINYDNEDCILSVFVDITERKKMEDELRRSNAELEQFAYIASHDLQEPLRAVTGMVQLLQKRYQGKLDERADEYISHAVEAAGRMQALIQALLSYSRVDRRNQPMEPVEAGDCLETALRNLVVSIRESHAVITVDDLPVVTADPTQLVQLFQNLVGNSLKFRGGREPQVHISVSRLKDAWQFSVGDNGIGIEPQYFERIFLIFQRLHTRREYDGTGIGLALCKKIVERHGGSIWVESTFGEGSTFYFTLPMRNMDHEHNPQAH